MQRCGSTREGAPLKISLNARNDVLWSNHVHATGELAHDIRAQANKILLVPIPYGKDA